MPLPNERRVKQSIRQLLEGELEKCYQLLDLGIGLPAPEKFNRSQIAADALVMMVGLYTKACLSYRSVIHLCEAGLDRSAASINRSLLETLLNLAFLARRKVSLYHFNNGKRTPVDLHGKKLTPEFRTVLYCAYCLIRDKAMFGHWATTPGLKRTGKYAHSKLSGLSHPHILALGPDWEKQLGKNPTTCAGIPIKDFAESLGKHFLALYRSIYAVDSQNVHQSDAFDYVEVDDACNHFEPKWHTSPDKVRWALRQASMVFLGCVIELEKRFRFGDKIRQQIKVVDQDLRNWTM
jgi:hypothetical protein